MLAAPTSGDRLPAWSPDGTQIAFVRGGNAIVVAAADGTGAERVAVSPDRPSQLDWAPAPTPVWLANFRLLRAGIVLGPGGDSFALSPDGHFAASSDGGACPQCHPPLVLTRVFDGQRRVLVRAGSNSDPTFSPDGRSIAFSRGFFAKNFGEYSRAPGLWRVRVNGTGLQRLTNGFAFCPKWSPDGKRIAYLTSTGAVRMVSATGRGNRLLLARGGDLACGASWSPDSRTLALVRTSGARLMTLNVTTGAVRALTPPGVLDPPRWSPDGTELLFSRALGYCAAVEIVGANGGGLRQLTHC